MIPDLPRRSPGNARANSFALLSRARLSNEKPSAIFRLRGTTITPSSTAQFQGAGATGATANSNVATLGILCEPLESIATQLAGLASTSGAPLTTSNALVPAAGASSSSTIGLGGAGGPPPSADATVQLAQLIGKNLFNAVAGFVKPLANVPGDGWIEFGQVENWYRNFETKLRTRGAGFLLQSD